MNIRPLEPQDWKQVTWLASNEVQEGDHSLFGAVWARNRMDFSGRRVHAVVESEGRVVAYCSLEHDSADVWRGFIVLDWSAEDTAVRESAFSELEKFAREKSARSVWMREIAEDKALLDFVKSKGFNITRAYRLDGVEMLNLEKSYES
jgi:hypothetical protein